jgi:hypothetical protein
MLVKVLFRFTRNMQLIINNYQLHLRLVIQLTACSILLEDRVYYYYGMDQIGEFGSDYILYFAAVSLADIWCINF